jgi:hypothetical protein
MKFRLALGLSLAAGALSPAAHADDPQIPPPEVVCVALTIVQPAPPNFYQERCVIEGGESGAYVKTSLTLDPGNSIFVDDVRYRLGGSEQRIDRVGLQGEGNGQLPNPGKGKVTAYVNGSQAVVACYFIDLMNPPGWQIYPLHACWS